ncbi:glycosyltransferase family 2 protein [Halioglobus pacificus]|uniref:glycosyltransferase family 2 protein n=1 Tax=Parahalioglobus pacificus TaxID=930806 RepID=UPI0016740E78|nr:glycosyltransferase family 2 protein [Halioglobus pacificus]
MPTLSIVIVTFNAGGDIERTLDSVFSQNYQDYEVVLIDGASTDGTIESLENYSSRLDYCISEPDEGIYDAMNKGIAAARGDYLQFLNAGDCFSSECALDTVFSSPVSLLPPIIYGGITIFDETGPSSMLCPYEFTEEQLLQFGTRVVCHQALFVRRAWVPLYDTRYRFKAELNWYFDLVHLHGDNYRKLDHSIVNYELGGYGHQHLIRNRFDWLRVVYNRYGVRAIFEHGLLKFIWKNSFHTYAWLRTVDQMLTFPVRAWRKLKHLLG